MAVAKKKKTATATKKTRVRLTTPPFRVSFPSLDKAVKFGETGTAKFGLTGIWTPDKFTERERNLWRAMQKEINRVSMEKFGKPAKELPSNYRKPVRNGNEKSEMEAYGEGTRFANMSSKDRPHLVDVRKESIEASDIYPGCYARATINVYAYEAKNDEGKIVARGISLGLNNVQKLKDGERLDSRVAAEDDFDEELDSNWLDQDDEGDFDEDDEDGDDEDEDDFD